MNASRSITQVRRLFDSNPLPHQLQCPLGKGWFFKPPEWSLRALTLECCDSQLYNVNNGLAFDVDRRLQVDRRLSTRTPLEPVAPTKTIKRIKLSNPLNTIELLNTPTKLSR